jgi:hypothetical protein
LEDLLESNLLGIGLALKDLLKAHRLFYEVDMCLEGALEASLNGTCLERAGEERIFAGLDSFLLFLNRVLNGLKRGIGLIRGILKVGFGVGLLGI